MDAVIDMLDSAQHRNEWMARRHPFSSSPGLAPGLIFHFFQVFPKTGRIKECRDNPKIGYSLKLVGVANWFA